MQCATSDWLSNRVYVCAELHQGRWLSAWLGARTQERKKKTMSLAARDQLDNDGESVAVDFALTWLTFQLLLHAN